jgi:hypothetical protein
VTRSEGGALLTLEPLVEAVRAGIDRTGWTLSGIQKTTSHQFEGEWEGESARSAYLFFHCPSETGASIEAYVDETIQGLAGNLALVVDLAPLSEIGDPARALAVLGPLARSALPAGYAAPLTLRLRLENAGEDPSRAEVEIRFKIRISRRVIARGAGAVAALAEAAVAGFERILAAGELERYRPVG